jgi:hypothetical protein
VSGGGHGGLESREPVRETLRISNTDNTNSHYPTPNNERGTYATESLGTSEPPS